MVGRVLRTDRKENAGVRIFVSNDVGEVPLALRCCLWERPVFTPPPQPVDGPGPQGPAAGPGHSGLAPCGPILHGYVLRLKRHC